MKDESTKHKDHACWHCHFSGIGFGFLLLLIGVFLLAKEMGWVRLPLTFLPLFLTLFGIFLIAKSTGRG